MPLGIKITLSSIVSMLIVALIMGWAGITAQSAMEHRFHTATAEGRALLWSSFIESDIQDFEGDVKKLTSNRAFKKALKELDINMISEEVGQSFSYMYADNVVNRAYVFNVNGEIIHSEGDNKSAIKAGDLSAIAVALNQGKVIKGLDIDSDGKIMEVISFPVTLRGKLIGGVIFLKDLQDSVIKFKNKAHSEALVINNRKNVTLATNPELSQPILNSVNVTPMEEKFFVQDVGGIYWATSTHMLQDANNERIGTLVVAADYTKSYSNEKSSNLIGMIVTFVAILLAMTAIFYFVRKLLMPLKSISSTLKQVANGDLRNDIDVTCNDEIGVLQESAKIMTGQLKDLLSNIRDITDHLANSAHTMNESSKSGLLQSESQQKSASFIAQSMSEMTSKASNVRSHALEAAEATIKIDTGIQDSSHIIEKSIANIHSVADQIQTSCLVLDKLHGESNSISDFLSVIKGVAEQTNLLALNAAIEAARAGESGRGFAVVADEVRTLSARTQEAADQIQEMTAQLQKQSTAATETMNQSKGIAQNSVAQSAEAAESLTTITKAIETIKNMNKSIAQEASEQCTMAEGVNNGIEEIRISSLDSTNSSQEIDKHSSHLDELADKLKVVVSRFKI